MWSERWKRIACAVCLSLLVAGAYKAWAVPMPGRAAAPRPAAEDTVVHGRRLLTFGGYQLDVSFTPAGRLVCLDITGVKS